MTNEEKSKEIADYVSGETDYKESAAYDAAIHMAEWKDEYYKKLLDLLVKSGANVDIITNYIENCIEL